MTGVPICVGYPEFSDKAAGFFKKPACKLYGLKLNKSYDTPIVGRPYKGLIITFIIHLTEQPIPIPHSDPQLGEVGLKCGLEQWL